MMKASGPKDGNGLKPKAEDKNVTTTLTVTQKCYYHFNRQIVNPKLLI